MKPSPASLEEQRELVLAEMRTIERMRRGTLSRHFLRRQRGGRTLTHGPYFVLQGYWHGQKFSEHIPGEQAGTVAEQVKNYQRFQQLADRFVGLTDQMTQREATSIDSKKNSNPRRSPTSASERPRPS
jgi:hypothetical protein